MCKKTENKKVVAYLRVSTSTQVEKGQGLDDQQKQIIDYCKNNNINIVSIKVDSGISGTNENRTGLYEALDMLENNEADYIIVRDIGRLWRDIYNQAYVMKKLEECGKDFISIEEPNANMESLKNDPSQYLVNTIMQAIANYQRMEIKRKLAHGRQTKANKGDKACGIAPLGYKWNKETNTIIIDDETSMIVKDIFKQYQELKTLGKLQKYCNKMDYKTQQGKEFSKQSLKNILTNDFYKGIIRHGDIEKEGNQPIIINKITFGKVQSLLKSNSNL
jgi:DNA invertase Pin-like site-specific DNA recombinase